MFLNPNTQYERSYTYTTDVLPLTFYTCTADVLQVQCFTHIAQMSYTHSTDIYTHPAAGLKLTTLYIL